MTADDTPLRRVYTFNAAHPVGTPVRYWPGVREGEGKPSRTATTAWLLGGHTPVVRIADHSSAIALTHIQPWYPTDTDLLIGLATKHGLCGGPHGAPPVQFGEAWSVFAARPLPLYAYPGRGEPMAWLCAACWLARHATEPAGEGAAR